MYICVFTEIAGVRFVVRLLPYIYMYICVFCVFTEIAGVGFVVRLLP